MKTRILFVDDEPLVLQGLQRMLHGERNHWEMDFVASGPEALRQLETRAFDVVVSDMRMPGMDGAQLLNEVMRRHPHTVRFILSGHADRSMVMRCVGSTHQFLSKPCDVDGLRSTLARAGALKESLVDEDLRRLVGRIRELPSLPRLYHEIQSRLVEPDVDLAGIGALVAQDVGMTADILKLVNSGFFGLGRGITNAAEAVGYLGVETIKTLVLTMHVFSNATEAPLPEGFLESLRRHSVDVALLARAIAESESLDRPQCDSAFAAGMLHDIGRLILREHLPEACDEAERFAAARALPVWLAEVAVHGASYADLGAYLLGLWGLPHPVVEAIKFQHRPSLVSGSVLCPLGVLHVADAFVTAERLGTEPEAEAILDTEFVERLGLTERLRVWRTLVRSPRN